MVYTYGYGQLLFAEYPSYFFLVLRPVTIVELCGKADFPLNKLSLSEKKTEKAYHKFSCIRDEIH